MNISFKIFNFEKIEYLLSSIFSKKKNIWKNFTLYIKIWKKFNFEKFEYVRIKFLRKTFKREFIKIEYFFKNFKFRKKNIWILLYILKYEKMLISKNSNQFLRKLFKREFIFIKFLISKYLNIIKILKWIRIFRFLRKMFKEI